MFNDRSVITSETRIARHHNTKTYALPGGMNQYDVLRLVKRIAPRIGINDTLLRQYELMISCTKEIDWQEGNLCICWLSVERIAEELGKSVRTVQYNTDQLIEMGIISMRLSGNYRRGGQRDASGRIKWASGADMKPVVERLEEFQTIADALDQEIEQRQMLGKQISSIRREIRSLLDQHSKLDELADVTRSIIAKRPRLTWTLERLRELWAELEQIWSRIVALLNTQANTQDDVSVGKNCRHGCNQLQTLIQITTQTPDISVEACHSAAPDHVPRVDTPRGRISPPDLGEQETRPASETLSIGQVLQMIENNSMFQGLIGDLPTTRTGLITHAERICSLLGISPDAWHQAVQVMGEAQAATAVASIEAKGTRVRNAGGYLRGMTKKAMIGELRLGKTVRFFARKNA